MPSVRRTTMPRPGRQPRRRRLNLTRCTFPNESPKTSTTFGWAMKRMSQSFDDGTRNPYDCALKILQHLALGGSSEGGANYFQTLVPCCLVALQMFLFGIGAGGCSRSQQGAGGQEQGAEEPAGPGQQAGGTASYPPYTPNDRETYGNGVKERKVNLSLWHIEEANGTCTSG